MQRLQFRWEALLDGIHTCRLAGAISNNLQMPFLYSKETKPLYARFRQKNLSKYTDLAVFLTL